MLNSIFDRIRRIDDLICTKSCKTPKQLAEKIGVSERTIYEYINLMKDMDAPIAYNRDAGYHYTEEGNFIIGFQTKPL